jgi:hypothetical protein
MGSELYLGEVHGNRTFILRTRVIVTQGPTIMLYANYWI